MSMYTNIRLSKKTVQRLKNIGKKGETYDDIINRLIDEHEKMEKARLENTTMVRTNGY